MRRIWGSLPVLVLLGLTGCGSSSRHAAASTTTASEPAPTHSTATGTFATLAPARIFADGVHALAGARSFDAIGTERRSGTTTSVRVSYEAPQRVEARVEDGSAGASIIATPFAAYINANVGFAEQHFGGLPADEARDLADRWLELDGRLGAAESRPLLQFSPQRLSACLAESFPDPTVIETTTRYGQPVVVLHSASTGAGAADLSVSLAAPHYPVVFRRLSPRTITLRSDPCEQSAGEVGVIRFSDWNRSTVVLPNRATLLP